MESLSPDPVRASSYSTAEAKTLHYLPSPRLYSTILQEPPIISHASLIPPNLSLVPISFNNSCDSEPKLALLPHEHQGKESQTRHENIKHADFES